MSKNLKDKIKAFPRPNIKKIGPNGHADLLLAKSILENATDFPTQKKKLPLVIDTEGVAIESEPEENKP